MNYLHNIYYQTRLVQWLCNNRTSSTTKVATIELVVSKGECVGLTKSNYIEIETKVDHLMKQR